MKEKLIRQNRTTLQFASLYLNRYQNKEKKMGSLRQKIQYIIQLHIMDKNEQQNLCLQLINYDYELFFSELIQIAQEIQRALLLHYNSPSSSLTNTESNKLAIIAGIINRQIIFLIQSKKFANNQQILYDLRNVFLTIFNNKYLTFHDFLQSIRPSLQELIINFSADHLSQTILTFQQIMQEKQEIDLTFNKALLNSVKNIQILTKSGCQMIIRFSHRFFITLQTIVKQLAYMQTQEEAVHLVSQRVQKWSLFLELLIEFLQNVYENEDCFETILWTLNKQEFDRIINEILKIDDILQIKPPIQQQFSCEQLGLGMLVSCKYPEFNQNLNKLKTKVFSIINFILLEIKEEKVFRFQDIIKILNYNVYQEVIGDLCYVSRQYLQFQLTNFLHEGQYFLIEKFYEFLNFSLKIPILRDRLFAVINQTMGWQTFLLFVCVINIKQFQWQDYQAHQNVKNGNYSIRTKKNVIQNRMKQDFVTNLLKSTIQHRYQCRDKLISLSTSIASYTIKQSDKSLKKILQKFGVNSQPFLQQFLSNQKNLNFWLHIINQMTVQINRSTDIQVLTLIEKSSDQLIDFTAQRLKQFLTLYLKLSQALIQNQKGCEIIDKVINKVLQLIQNCHIEDRRAQLLFLFLTKFMIRYGNFYKIHNVDKLLRFCFNKIQRFINVIQQCSDRNVRHQQSKSIKIYINFIIKLTQENMTQDGMTFLDKYDEFFKALMQILSNNCSKLSHKQTQLICQLVESLLKKIVRISCLYKDSRIDCSNEDFRISQKLNQLIESLIGFLINIRQVYESYFLSAKLLLCFFGNSISNQILTKHILEFVSDIFKKQQLSKNILSFQLKSIVQVLFLISIHTNHRHINNQIWQNACIMVIKQCKKKLNSQETIKMQQKLTQSPRKVIVKNRLKLQLQAFKLTIFMLSTHCKKFQQPQKLNCKAQYSKDDTFLQCLHKSISLSKELKSFEEFLNFEDLEMICYSVDNYVGFMSFKERRDFLVQMAILLSEIRIPSYRTKIDRNMNYLPQQFNAVYIIRCYLFDTLYQIEQYLKEQNMQKYQNAIRVLLKRIQSLTVVGCQQRQILKLKHNNQEVCNKQNQGFII